MFVKDAIDAQGNLLKKLPWISNLQIKSIQQRSPNYFQITLVNGRSLTANGDDELESLKAPVSTADKAHGPRHESAADRRSRLGWDMSPDDYRAFNFRRRNQVLS